VSVSLRVAAAGGLLVLGASALPFLGTQVTRCLGPLGRTLADSIRDGCIEPSVGPGMPLFAVALVAASLLLVQGRPAMTRPAIGWAAIGAMVGVIVYLLVRPTSVTGPTSTGEVITVALPFDRWALLTTAIVGAGLGWLVSRWPRRPRLAQAT
jgi:hypothetical protein